LAVEAAPSASAEPQRQSRVLRNVAFLASSQIVTWSLTMVWIVIVPRAVGADGMGRLVIGQSVPAILGVIAALGMTTLLVKETAREPNQAPGLIADLLLVRLALLVPGFIAIAIYIHLTHFDAQQQLLLYLGTGSTFVGLLTEVSQGAFMGIQRMEYVAYSGVLSKTIVTLAAVTLVLLRFGVVALMVSSLLIAVLVLVLNLQWLRKRFMFNLAVVPRRISRRAIDSLPYWAGALFLTIYIWIDSTLLSLMAPTRVVGWYGIATQIFASLLFGVTIIGAAWFPRLSAAFIESQPAFRLICRSALIFTLMLSLPIATGVALVAGPVIHLIYGAQFSSAVPPLIILATCLPLTYLNTMSYQILAAANKQVAWTKVMALATILNPVINIVLIRHFQDTMHNGAIGAALSLCATELIMAMFAIGLLPWIWDQPAIFRVVRGLVAVLLMAIVVTLAAGLGLIAQVLAGAISFAALAVILRLLTADELAFIRHRLAVIQRRLSPGMRRAS
jgi:O-antigen/teichoic acid export membrane protein